MHVFGQWGEAGVPRENSRIHGENMQTPHRKAPAGIQTVLLWGNGADHHTAVQPMFWLVLNIDVSTYLFGCVEVTTTQISGPADLPAEYYL